MAFLAVFPTLVGCATNSNVETLSVHVNELKDNADQMEGQLARTGCRVEIIEALGRQAGAQLAAISARLDAVDHKLQEMKGTLERSTFDTDRVKGTLRIQFRELQNKLSQSLP
ncbi:MAG: hypothetical protein JRG73_11255 [Deltaproteobacteria bacterium]|nr:hypothetical protein [Deltaproteobacteria bacterium]